MERHHTNNYESVMTVCSVIQRDCNVISLGSLQGSIFWPDVESCFQRFLQPSLTTDASTAWGQHDYNVISLKCVKGKMFGVEISRQPLWCPKVRIETHNVIDSNHHEQKYREPHLAFVRVCKDCVIQREIYLCKNMVLFLTKLKRICRRAVVDRYHRLKQTNRAS